MALAIALVRVQDIVVINHDAHHSACLTPIRALIEPYSIKTDSSLCI
ncbi:MAG: hypothetical protein ACKO3I_11200 [Synechococcales cyanobacterium]